MNDNVLLATVTLRDAQEAAAFDTGFREAIGSGAMLHDHVRLEMSSNATYQREAQVFVRDPEWANQVLGVLFKGLLFDRMPVIYIHCWRPGPDDHSKIIMASTVDWEVLIDFEKDFSDRLLLLRPNYDLKGFVLGVPRHVVEQKKPPLLEATGAPDRYSVYRSSYASVYERPVLASASVQLPMTAAETDAEIKKLLKETDPYVKQMESVGAKPWSAEDERLFAGRCRVCRFNDALWFTEECNHALLCPGCYVDFMKMNRLLECCLVCTRLNPKTRLGPAQWTEAEERELVGCCRTCRKNEAVWFTVGCEHACYCEECYSSYFRDATTCPICKEEGVMFIDIMKQ